MYTLKGFLFTQLNRHYFQTKPKILFYIFKRWEMVYLKLFQYH